MSVDAVVVGSGPNGLAAALTLARAGLTVEVYERAPTAGGGCRTEPLTEPGFLHDTCSAVHPMLVASPFFRTCKLPPLLYPELAVAHPLGGDRAAAVNGSPAETARGLGADGRAWRQLFEPFVSSSDAIVDVTMAAPLRRWPSKPVLAARFAAVGASPASTLIRHRFSEAEAKALFAGVAAHSIRPLSAPLTSAFGLLLTTLAHSVGWPVVEGGSQKIVDALVSELESLGGRVVTDHSVKSLAELPVARTTLLDVTPRQLLHLADRPGLGSFYARQLGRFRFGPGVCKVDWALSGPVPWTAEPCRRTVTVHVGGEWEAVAGAEADVAAGRHPARPFCLVVQPAVVDSTRAPAGRHPLWAYCHVPAGSTVDMTELIEAQIERFAPGFRDLITARTTATAVDTEAHNPNYIGGDIGSGAVTVRQTLFRPTVAWNPYRTGIKGVYLCGASTPPGAGVHGMCGYWAARTALSDLGLDA